MKKLFFGFIVLSFLAMPFGTVKAADAVDQSCDLSGGGGLGQFHDSNSYQTFTPSMNRLSKVLLYLDGGAGGTPITLVIAHGATGIINAGTQNSPVGNGTLTYDFPDIAVTPGDSTYRIWPQTGGGFVDWIITGPNCYAGGNYIQNGNDGGSDAGFVTYGYNVAAPAEATPAPASSSAATTDSPTSTANVSSTIKAPSALTASSTNGQAVLTWKASSSTDIDGYKIYRSTEEKKNFKEITKVDKKILTYTDPAAAGTYYYYIRAYKGTSVSNVSNTASAILAAATVSPRPSATPVPTASDTAQVKSFWSVDSPWMWVLIAVVFFIVAGGGFLYYRKKKKLPKI